LPVKPGARIPESLLYVRMAGSQSNVPVKLPSLLSGALTPVMSMLMVTTICWPMLGVALEGVAAEVTLPVGAIDAEAPPITTLSIRAADTGATPSTTLPNTRATSASTRQ
jgi:hypothetical protein